jgi:hypothetical protein
MAFNLSGAEQPPDALAETVRISAPDGGKGAEKRTCKRYPVIGAVGVMILDDALEPTGPPFVASTRNISRSGIAVISKWPVNTGLIAVECPCNAGNGSQFIVQVMRCRPLRSFYEIAGKFLTRMIEPDEG